MAPAPSWLSWLRGGLELPRNAILGGLGFGLKIKGVDRACATCSTTEKQFSGEEKLARPSKALTMSKKETQQIKNTQQTSLGIKSFPCSSDPDDGREGGRGGRKEGEEEEEEEEEEGRRRGGGGGRGGRKEKRRRRRKRRKEGRKVEEEEEEKGCSDQW
ncbi:High mobility group nucleosome-binding domain-containing protein 5, partial [Ophiophagus hannah]